MDQAQEIDVRHVAKLARLELDDAEIALYERELGTLLAHVAELKDLATEHIAATAQVIATSNMLRDDRVAPGLTREEFLAGAPDTQLGMVRVPRILAEVE